MKSDSAVTEHSRRGHTTCMDSSVRGHFTVCAAQAVDHRPRGSFSSIRYRGAALLTAILCLAPACTGAISPVVSGGAAAGGGGGTSSQPGGGGSMSGAAGADVGTVALRQLTIAEYNATVRDLLGTSLHPADSFESSIADGFDTIASAGIINSRKVAAYFDAAQALVDDVFGNPALRARIVTCQPAAPGDTSCARGIISAFGLKTFRRPLDAGELAGFLSQYQNAQAQMLSHEDSVKEVVRIMLASPQFIYRMEFDPDPMSTVAHPLSGYEVASRLSYTIWSSTPDDQLLQLAGTGQLLSAPGLKTQVDRLLADPRSSALVDNFAGQWLGSRRLAAHVADVTIYPAWSDSLKASMQNELGLYFDTFLHGDQTYDRFLTANINYVDANLAPLYGVPVPAVPGMVKVQNAVSHRAGFLGLAGFLTHTSRPERSAPTIRGQWILDALQCVTLELPANFSPPPLDAPKMGQTVRQLLELHGSAPACAPCHTQLDPVGLSLEHFDGIGRYRDAYADGSVIDATGVLPGGQHFDGMQALSQLLSQDPRFLPCAAQKLFTFAIGRTVAASDAPYIGQMVDGWKTDGLGLRNLVKQLVGNDTFRLRRGNP
jgi:hypothetical protein